MRRCYFFLLMFAFGCMATAQVTNEIQHIQFTSSSRGYHKEVTISQDSLIISERSRTSDTVAKRGISSKEWKSLLATISDLSLNEIESLQSPGEKRAYDGARHSAIRISVDGQSFSHDFDDENPHPKLNGLMIGILKLAEQAN